MVPASISSRKWKKRTISASELLWIGFIVARASLETDGAVVADAVAAALFCVCAAQPPDRERITAAHRNKAADTT
ncbi:hypothetical protein D3C73_1581630 [compost metagenome]